MKTGLTLITCFFVLSAANSVHSQDEFYSFGVSQKIEKSHWNNGSWRSVRNNYLSFGSFSRTKLKSWNWEFGLLFKELELNSSYSSIVGDQIVRDYTIGDYSSSVKYGYASFKLFKTGRKSRIPDVDFTVSPFLEAELKLYESETDHFHSTEEYSTYWLNTDSTMTVNYTELNSSEAFDAASIKPFLLSLGAEVSADFHLSRFTINPYLNFGFNFSWKFRDNKGYSFSDITSHHRGSPRSSLPKYGSKLFGVYQFGIRIKVKRKRSHNLT